MSIEEFGEMPNGDPVHRISLAAGNLRARILTFGAVLQDLRLEGHSPALVLGFDSFAPYLIHSPHFGATAGRCANRIRDGHLPLGGKVFTVDRNIDGQHHLHGGARGTGSRNWQVSDAGVDFVCLTIRLLDGEMGYPGNLDITQTYRLFPNGVLDIAFMAETDQLTLCNLAHHSYFNLDGGPTIEDHLLTVDACDYTLMDENLVPTGEIRSLQGNVLNFMTAKKISAASQQGLLDHNYCLATKRRGIQTVGEMASPLSGVKMEIRTTEPGLQIYDGAKIDIPVAGLDGVSMGPRAGLAIEPQIWPDAVHHPEFPQALLAVDETYRQHTQFVFSKA